jgi:predicted CoA-binding protein
MGEITAMTTRQMIQDFLAQRRLAIVGVSRSGKKFGNVAYRDLAAKGYCLFPEPVGAVLVVVPPDQAERVVRDAAAAGIQRIWMQPGAESEAALHFCQQNGVTAIHGECILMFAEPVGFGHRAHRWIWGLLGKLPK